MSLRPRKTLTSGSNALQPKTQQSPQTPSKSKILSSDSKIFVFCLVFRSINSLLIQTYFNPDEYWQSLEVAHRIAFGYGHLTWEWKMGIRSYLHPLIFAALYKVLGLLRLDTLWFMMRAPRLLQSFFASFGDLYMYKLSRLVFDEHVARWAIFCQLTNWFMFYCITRTFSNSMEAVLTVVGLYYWFSYGGPKKKICISSRMLALVVAALACCIRPTSAITWVYVGVLELLGMQDSWGFIFLEL